MLIKAYSNQEAIAIAQEKYSCSSKQLEVTVVKKSFIKLKGLIRIKGKYNIIFVLLEEEKKTENKQSYKDGSIRIVNGKAIVKDPIDNGKYPYIIAEDPNIDVHINGRRVSGTELVTESDKIELVPRIIEPFSEIKVKVSKDRMQAMLSIHKGEGIEFQIADTTQDIQLKVLAEIKCIKHKQITTSECLSTLLNEGIKMEFIDMGVISQLVESEINCNTIVANGREPVSGTKTQIKYYFNDHFNYDSDNYKEVNLEETIVQLGDVLAIKQMPAVQGCDGMNVFGETIKVKEIEDQSLIAGKGVILLDNGLKAVAINSGRPTLRDGIISIVPLLVIPGNLDKEAGDIDFDGDILIKGSIMDNMKVVSKGNITVYGSVYNSVIVSKGNISIMGKAIGGKMRAGGSVITFFCLLPQLEIINNVIIKLLDISEDEQRPNKQNLFYYLRSEKNTLDKSMNEINRVLLLLDDYEAQIIVDGLNSINNLVRRISLFYITSTSEIQDVYDKINANITLIANRQADGTNISVSYTQNVTIQSCGNIIITGSGTYQSTIFAKDSIIYKNSLSHAKGGILVAGKHIFAGYIGSNAGIQTYCKVTDGKGRVMGKFYNGTVINIDGDIKIINKHNKAAV